MSFQVNVKAPINAPAAPAQPQSSRDRAIAAMQNQPAPEAPQPGVPPINQSNVALEDYSAAHPPKAPSQAPESSQENTSEVSAAATSEPEAAKAPNLSAQYAQLARQEKIIRAAQSRLKADQVAFKASQDAAKAPAPTLYDTTRHIDREALKSDPFKVLADLGLTYDQLAQQALNAPSPEQVQLSQTISELRSQISELKQAQEKVNKTFEETQTQSYQQAINQIKSDTHKLVNSDPAFETIKATGAINDVVELIEKTFKEDKDAYGNPVLLTVEEAAKLVEDEISDRLYTYANKVDKIKKRFNPTSEPAAARSDKQQQQEPKQQQRPTLTNQIGTSGKLSAKERATLAGKYGPDWRNKVGA